MSDYSPKAGRKVKLKDYDPNDNGGLKREEAAEKLAVLQARFEQLQEKLYAQAQQALLIVFQALDTGGKDGTIRRVFSSITPAGIKVTSFKVPTAEEMAHDFLWRIHRNVPAKGYIGIFNRSHYEDVLVVRVNKLVPKSVWEQRYERINEFEKLLTDSGTRIIKFYLHIDKKEQKERLQARLDDPEKHWKFSPSDLPVREQWDEYQDAYEDALTKCNTDYAPWVIVPANRKWYRDLVVMQTIVDTMETMDLAFPPAPEGLDQIVIPD